MSLNIKTLLCAIDLSSHTEHVITAAIEEARAHDARIQLLHILPSFDSAMAVPIVSFMGEDRFTQLKNEKKEETIAAIRKKIDELHTGINEKDPKGGTGRIEDIHVYEGDPVVEILNMTNKLHADMLVMGSHGKGTSEHTFVGSVARKVLKRAKVRVLLVPAVER